MSPSSRSTDRPAVLVIAGSDSSGGAGLQRDLRVLADLGAEGVSVVTAVTAQSDRAVMSSLLVPPRNVLDQIRAAADTRPVGAVKIGMLGSRPTVEAVVQGLGDLPDIPVVLDPVLASSSGTDLLDEFGREVLRDLLVPMATLVTPNLPEAAALLGEARSEGAAEELAGRFLALGPRAVLLKGGHSNGSEAIDWLMEKGSEPVRLAAPRLAARMRGTGCALSTAIAVHLAENMPLAWACAAAKSYVFKQIQQTATR